MPRPASLHFLAHGAILLGLIAVGVSAAAPHGILVVRPTPQLLVGTGAGDCEATELWLVDRAAGTERLLVRGRDDRDPAHIIADISRPVFSPDGTSVYFLSAAYAVTGTVKRVDLATGAVTNLIDGTAFEVIPRGPYAGHLLVERALIKRDAAGNSLGRDGYTWLVSADGRPLREIGPTGGPEDARFKAQNLPRSPTPP